MTISEHEAIKNRLIDSIDQVWEDIGGPKIEWEGDDYSAISLTVPWLAAMAKEGYFKEPEYDWIREWLALALRWLRDEPEPNDLGS